MERNNEHQLDFINALFIVCDEKFDGDWIAFEKWMYEETESEDEQ